MVDLLRLREDSGQLLLEVADLEGLVGPVVPLRSLGSGAVARPGLRFPVPGLHEEGVGGAAVGAKDRHRLRVIEAGQVPEVAVLPEGILGVVRAGGEPSAQKQRYGTLTHRVEKEASALCVHGEAAYRMRGGDSQRPRAWHTTVTPLQ